VANYIAKYTTKAADVPGLPDTRIRTAAAIAALRCSAHHKRMVTTAWQLGAHDSVDDPRLRLWAHMLGYGGHSSPNPAATPSASASSAAPAPSTAASSATAMPTPYATRGPPAR